MLITVCMSDIMNGDCDSGYNGITGVLVIMINAHVSSATCTIMNISWSLEPPLILHLHYSWISPKRR